jgi:hypothetical protein
MNNKRKLTQLELLNLYIDFQIAISDIEKHSPWTGRSLVLLKKFMTTDVNPDSFSFHDIINFIKKNPKHPLVNYCYELPGFPINIKLNELDISDISQFTIQQHGFLIMNYHGFLTSNKLDRFSKFKANLSDDFVLELSNSGYTAHIKTTFNSMCQIVFYLENTKFNNKTYTNDYEFKTAREFKIYLDNYTEYSLLDSSLFEMIYK